MFAAVSMLSISHAGTNTYYFNSPDSTNGLANLSQGGGGYWLSSGGSPYDPEATDPSTNGYFVVTDPISNQRGIIIFPDFDSGQVVKAFQFACDVRIGAGANVPADGFSICFAATNDPVLVNNDGSGWATGPNGEANLPEEGTQTGLAVSFDTWDSGYGDVIGLTIRVDNSIIKNVPLPFLNLAPSDPNFAASLQTGTNDAGLAGLTWRPLSVEYTTNCLLNVAYKGVTLLTNFLTPFSPTVGRIVLGGRTGAAYQSQHLDNLRIVTIPTTSPTVGPPSGNSYGFTISIHDSGAATPDTNALTVQLDGVTIISYGTNVSPQTATVSQSGVTTTIGYSQATPFAPGSSHSVRVIFSGTGFSGTVDETRSFVAPTRHYVDINSVSPTPPYSNWATAATNIQHALDVAGPDDEVVVTNGVYFGWVGVEKPLKLRSVNGPSVTVINGGGINQCASLRDGASLSGFTLTNGSAGSGAGVWCTSTNAFLTNCVITGNVANYGYGGGAHSGTLYECTLSGNRAYDGRGGGAQGCILYNCTLSGNAVGSYGYGGGAYECTLYNCTLTGNFAGYYGGGADSCTLSNCTLAGNSDGGAYGSTLYSCTLSGNSAGSYGYNGGGADWCTLYNCTLTGNSATGSGGGAYEATLYNCTLTGNSADFGGGAYRSTLTNCIVYFNTAASGGANYDPSSSTLSYCCTTPLPTNGVGNIALDPQMASASHLSASSPCRAAGSAADTTGTDIDGEPWASPPSIGCDEYNVDAVTGPLTVRIMANYTNVVVGYPLTLTALIEGRTIGSAWDFGDSVVVSNQPYASHTWTAAGDYLVVLSAFNESHPGGVSATVTVHLVAEPVVYVAAGNARPQPPYTTWTTAATNLQDAVDAPLLGALVVAVSNGVYLGGVAVAKPLAVRSVNGPQFTVINGAGTNQCASLTNGASLSGFTLTNGAANSGGGVWCASANACLTNCVLTGNSAGSSGYGGGAYGGTLYNCSLTGNLTYYGGGAYGCVLYNCTLSGNSASYGGGVYSSTLYNCSLTGNSSGSPGYGGGAHYSTLNNCTLTGNSAYDGGGAYGSTLTNCIVYFNTAASGVENYSPSYSSLNYCCATPLPTNGVGNIALDPQLASASHLSASSPCLGAGRTGFAIGTDIDGESWASPPSIGCDELHPGAVTGPLAVEWRADRRAVTPGYQVAFTAFIEGRPTASVWDFGDTVVSNRPYANHAWTTPGDYAVVLRAYNDSQPGEVSVTGMVRVAVQPLLYVAASSSNPVLPYLSWATAAADIQDAVDTTVSGAVLVVSNGLYATGGRDGSRVAVDRQLAVRSVNGPQFTVIDGGGAVQCVHLTNGASLSGFTLTNGWANNGGGVWCESPNAFLTNCTLSGNLAWYGGGGASGGTLYNCTLTDNGAENYGGAAQASSLYDCTLSANWANGSGGGAYWCTLSNCALSANWAEELGGGADESELYNCMLTGNGAGHGGGASGGTLYNCTLTGNGAGYGGGASGATLYNCTLTANSAYVKGGGAYWSSLNNCIAYFNTAPASANYDSRYGSLYYCCTTPQPTNGFGNIANAPLFVDYAGGNLRPRSNSPCINAGNNAFVSGPTDVDGSPRIVRGTVDIGAYEFQGPGSAISYAWLQQYGLPTDGSADYLDSDGDGHNNWQEWGCATCPTNPHSTLCVVSALPTGANVTVTWQSMPGVTYHLLRSTNLRASPQFRLLATNLLGQAGTTSYTDTNAARLAPLFYRVGVGNYVAPTNPPRPALLCQFSAASRTLQFIWSGTGFRLQAQTNSLGVGRSTNWILLKNLWLLFQAFGGARSL